MLFLLIQNGMISQYIIQQQLIIIMNLPPPTEPNILSLDSDPNIPPAQLVQLIKPQPQPVKALTCIERATNLVDNITDSLYAEILTGLQSMSKRKPMPKNQDQKTQEKKRSIILEKPVDIDLHKRMIRKFMRMNRKSLKSIEQRSVEFQQEARKIREAENMRRNEQKNKTLEVRREKINERLKSKEALKQEIHKFVIQSNKRFGEIKTKKFLYQQKEEAFKRQVVLPKLQQQKRILNKLKQKAKPIDMTQILQHQKLYEQKLMNDRMNRSLTSRVLQSDNFYQPPKFVAKAYLIAEAEQEIKKEEEKLKEQQSQINQYRKKQFIKIMEEKQRLQFQRQRDLSLQKSRSNKTFSIETEKPKKSKPKSELNREQMKKIGNQYMKQLVSLNRMYKSKPQISSLSPEILNKTQDKRSKSQFQIQLIKEERIEKVQTLRLKKIEDILNSKFIDNHFKLQRLQHQNDKFDNLLSIQQDNLNKKSDADELASIVLSSIHTKLAILQVSSPKS